MGRKSFCVPALVASFLAWVLLLLCTISSPTTFHTSSPFNFVTATNLGNITDVTGTGASPDRQLIGLKLGTWGYCTEGAVDQSFDYCSSNQHGYNVTFKTARNDSQAAYETTEIKSSWTRGLVIVVVAFVVEIVAFILSFIPHLVVMLVASIVHFIAFLLALISFACEIALFIYTRDKLNNITSDISVTPGPGFYLNLIALPFLFFSALTVCCGWRREKRGDSYPATYESSTGGSKFGRFGQMNFANRFRRNKGVSGDEKIPMQTSRQRVLDAFKSDS